MRVRRRREGGLVLMVVLVFAVLLTGSIATFQRRAVVDTMIARNRESRAQAEALALGGIELAKALLIDDALRDAEMDTTGDLWAQVGAQSFEFEEGGNLRLRIEDAGARLNLNAVLLDLDAEGPDSNAEELLSRLLEKVIDEMPIPPAERALYDVDELVGHLIDWVDSDQERLRGGPESGPYDRRDPPVEPPNQPLLSLDELRLIEGFDAALVHALRPYVTVYPFAAASGINLNTAPPHVLALIFFNDGVEMRLAPEDVVRDILEARQDEVYVCGEGPSDDECTPIEDIVDNSTGIFPPPVSSSDVFTVTAEARVRNVQRRVEVVLDRRRAPEMLLLSWRVL